MAEYDVLGNWVKDYVYFGGQLVAEYRAGTLYYYASDQIRSTRIVTDSSGNVVYSAAHEPYGGIQHTWVSSYDPELKFSGKPRDAESGLDYFGARYYDRAQYRFISVDPVMSPRLGASNPQRWNLYSYCLNNPISCFDPDGRDVIRVILPGVGGTALHSWLDSRFADIVGKFLSECAELGINIEVTSAYRSRERQNQINPGVKNSLHSAGMAIDINYKGLSFLEKCYVGWTASDLGLEWGGNHKKSDPVHFNMSTSEDRRDLIEKASMVIAAFDFWGICGLSSQELYMLYGVFTERAAWLVIDQAERDLRPSSS